MATTLKFNHKHTPESNRGRVRLINQPKDLMAVLMAVKRGKVADGTVYLTNHVLTQLTKYGYITRERTAGKGRRYVIGLTDEGNELATRGAKGLAKAEYEALIKVGHRTLSHRHLQMLEKAEAVAA